MTHVAMFIPDNRDESCLGGPDPVFGTAPFALLQGFSMLDDVHVSVVSCTKRPMKSPVPVMRNVTYHNVLVPQSGWLRTLYSGCVMGIRRKLRELKPDIVHGQGTERYCGFAAAFSGYPNVITVHGHLRRVKPFLDARLFGRLWLGARLERVALSRTDGVVCLSTYSRNLVQSLNNRLWQIPNAVDMNFLDVPRNPDGKSLLCLADILPYKNQIGLIEALDRWDQVNRHRIVFAGRLPDKSPYSVKFLAKVKERNWCHYAGFADRPRVRELLQTAMAVVHPSLEDNYPMAILEAMAVGMPVAASRIGGIPDIIRDRHNGLLFDPLAPESIRKAIRTLLEGPELTGSLASRGKATIVEHNTPQKIALRHLQAYHELLAGHS